MHEFVRLAEQHGLARVVTVQNAYCLINRVVDNGLDETLHRLGVSLIPYSPLGFGPLTGKYDAGGAIRRWRCRARASRASSRRMKAAGAARRAGGGQAY